MSGIRKLVGQVGVGRARGGPSACEFWSSAGWGRLNANTRLSCHCLGQTLAARSHFAARKLQTRVRFSPQASWLAERVGCKLGFERLGGSLRAQELAREAPVSLEGAHLLRKERPPRAQAGWLACLRPSGRH